MKLKYIYIICALIAVNINYIILHKPLKGVVLDQTGEALIGANVIVKGTDLKTITDIEGKFEISITDSQNVLVVSYVGYETTEIITDNNFFLKVVLKESRQLLEECIIIRDRVKPKERSMAFTRASVSATSINGKVRGLAISKAKTSDKNIRGSSFISKNALVDGISINEIHQPAGQITAGEWNDLDNWDDWKSLNENPAYLEMQNYWSLFPNKRFSVFITSQYDFPVPNCQVTLLDIAGNPLWEAITDQAGRAELWENFNRNNEKAQSIRVRSHDKIYNLKKINSIKKGVMHLKIQKECDSIKQIDVAFVVDATGSMGDEIAYLKTELLDVIEKARSLRPNFQLNCGAVFYRDSSDAYLTQELSLTKKKEAFMNFINRQEASGGGDYPEAVEAGIEAALNFEWNEKSITRLLFILLDAPPHHNPAVLHNLNMQIREAAVKGIKIIPISASGINRQTEFLMKFISIATNGTYVFITDDSGIGNPHLDPVVKDFDVEFLNDLILRLIENYSKISRCNANQEIIDSSIKIYPNPCYNFANVELKEQVKSLRILSSSGRLIKELGSLEIGVNKLSLEQLISGIYTLNFIFENRQESKQIILLNG